MIWVRICAILLVVKDSRARRLDDRPIHGRFLRRGRVKRSLRLVLATPPRWRLARMRKARRARPAFDLEEKASVGLADVDRMLLQPMTHSYRSDRALEPFFSAMSDLLDSDDLPNASLRTSPRGVTRPFTDDELPGIVNKRRAIERLAIEQAAAGSDRRFRAALSTSPVTVFHLDLEQRYTWVYNPGGGFSPDEMIGRTNSELLGAEHAAELEARLRKVVAAGVGGRDEITLNLGGEQRTYDFTLQPRHGTSGEVIGLAGVAVDITGRHHAAAARRVSEARLRAMIDANPIGVIISDVHGNIIDANDAFLQLIGYSRDDLEAGRIRWLDLTPAEFLVADHAANEEARQKGVCTPYEKACVRKDGTIVPILVGYTLIGDTLERAIAFILDLTERKRTLSALEAAVTEKTLLAEQREGLLRDINHRIKNSLQLVASMLRIQIGSSEDPVLQQGLVAAERRVLTVAHLHDQLYRRRDFANSIEIGKYLHELGASLERTLIGNDTRIALRIAAQPVEVPTDKAVNIALILNELVTNAAKHAFRGRASGVVAVNFEVLADASFRLEVADDGNGMPVGFQPKTSGGLGMRILNALVGSLDASLQIESSDAGARFTVVIPA
jgi:PAS domain S-box-containing protein